MLYKHRYIIYIPMVPACSNTNKSTRNSMTLHQICKIINRSALKCRPRFYYVYLIMPPEFNSSLRSTAAAAGVSFRRTSTKAEMDLTVDFGVNINEAYRPLPSLYLGFLSIWFLSALSWTINTWKNRHFQTNNLQWALASIPVIKALQLGLSFLFWYSCFNLQICSLWMSFGVYITGVLFQTAAFVSFLLISHGYCIMCERLSLLERRTTALLGCGFYLTLVGYRASVPYFTILLVLNYFVSFYMIFHHISLNLLKLREQLTFIEDEDIQAMHDAIYTKYTMLKKFQGAMQIVAVAETLIYITMDNASDNYWLRLLVREWAQFCIYLYIGWTFRSRELSSRFSVMPAVKTEVANIVPPIYSIEMNARDFKDLNSRNWHIALPTAPANSKDDFSDSILVIVQHPRA